MLRNIPVVVEIAEIFIRKIKKHRIRPCYDRRREKIYLFELRRFFHIVFRRARQRLRFYAKQLYSARTNFGRASRKQKTAILHRFR